jgi:hypothetical protein
MFVLGAVIAGTALSWFGQKASLTTVLSEATLGVTLFSEDVSKRAPRALNQQRK